MPVGENTIGESSTYLTPPDFDDAEKHIKKYYKEIFEMALEAMWTDEED